MITRIELTNFMSHVHTVIEPAAGLTVLVGPNNCGKSAVVAALQILCRNDSSTYVVRHGERECGVTVVCDDGHTVEWRRKNSPSYRIDGQAFDRLGRGDSGLPAELHQALRLPKVDAADDSDFDVHFGAQKSPIFLLNSSSANAARFFASSSDAIRLVQMQKRHKEKLKAAQQEKNRLEAESLRVNAELAALEPAVDIDRRIKQLEAEHSKLLRLGENLAGLAAAIQALQSQADALARQAAQTQALASLRPAPQLSPTGEIEKLVADLPVATQRLDALTAEAAALAALAGPPALFDVAALQTCCTGIRSLEADVAASAARRDGLARLTPAPPFADAGALQTLIAQLLAAADNSRTAAAKSAALVALLVPPATADESPLARLSQELAKCERDVVRHQARLDRLSRIRTVPAPVDTIPLAECLRTLEEAHAQVLACKSQAHIAASELAEVEAALRAEAAGALCPICGTPLDPERILTNAATGGAAHAHG